MKNKILLLIALLVILLEGSGCRMHQEHARNNYFHATRTSRHWGRQPKVNVRHMFWGRHRYGPRPYTNRGHYRF